VNKNVIDTCDLTDTMGMSLLKLLSEFGQMEMRDYYCVNWQMVLLETWIIFLLNPRKPYPEIY
jgi:hypothetical protein